MIEQGERALRSVWGALHAPFNPYSDYFWLYLFTALAMAVFSYAWAGGRSPRTFLRETFSAAVWWHRSARLDYAFYLVNAAVSVMLFVPWLFTVAGVAFTVRNALNAAFGKGPVFTEITWWMVALYTIAQFIVRDFGLWVSHWLVHRVPVLWEFHKVHHTAEVLVPLTNARMHPVDLLIVSLFSNGCIGLVAGVAIYLGAGQIDLWQVFGLNVFLFAFNVLGTNLRHSPFWLSYGPALEKWLISPAQHQLHHSTVPRHLYKNLGVALAIWDRMFGTLYVPNGREQATYGLGDGSEAEYQSIGRLYLLPVKRAWALLFGMPGTTRTGT